ncbi:hypothetical protein E2C01_097151 [Portunus trituberculatus]|uniref:Uncharacterized protein n=1 Tax=Portunus trituberculatus TaxID=210409 RepID=A0A5B7K504_PORTR|nr:hypothetical protein [Portunus trituberculatus]
MTSALFLNKQKTNKQTRRRTTTTTTARAIRGESGTGTVAVAQRPVRAAEAGFGKPRPGLPSLNS